MYVTPPKIKDKLADKWAKALAPVLGTNETVWAFARVTRLRPQTEAIAVTNQRLLGFKSYAMNNANLIVFAVSATEIVSATFPEKLGAPRLVVTTKTGDINFGDIRKDELEFVQYYVRYLVDASQNTTSAGAGAGGEGEGERAPLTDTESVATTHLPRGAVRESAPVVGVPLDEFWARAVANNSGPDELPSFIISNGSAGLLVAFENRLVIVKAHALNRAAYESRAVAFPYADITELDYRRGLSDGVLEVRTSDSAGAALDSVRGWDGSAPNTLRLPWALHEQAAPYFDDLRRKVAAAQRRKPVSLWKPPLQPRIVDRPAVETAPTESLAVEIEKLANLFNQGLIDADEFREAKRAVIAAHS